MLANLIKKESLLENFISKRLLIFLLFLAVLLRLATLGIYPLMDTTESRYADVGRQIVERNDWVTPRYPLGEPYWGKPPLSFWFTAISFKTLGVSEFTSRLPSFLTAALLVLIVFYFARKFYGDQVAYLSSIILVSTGIFHVMSSVVSTDMALTATIAISMIAFIVAIYGEEASNTSSVGISSAGSGRPAISLLDPAPVKPGVIWGYVFFAGLGLSMLAKGPLGVALVFIAIFLWTVLFGEYRKVIFRLPWISGGILALAICLPWYLLMEQRNPGYLKYFLIGEHIYKYLQPGWKGDLFGNPHRQPFGSIWAFFLADALPWILMMLFALYITLKNKIYNEIFIRKPVLAYVFIWMLTPALLFTPAKNIQMTYNLYAMPAFAIFTSVLIVAIWRRESSIPRFLSPFLIKICAFSVLVFFAIFEITVLPGIAERNTQKGIIEYIVKQENGVIPKIVYVLDRVPFSASFYAKDNASSIIWTKEEKKKITTDAGMCYIVIRHDNDSVKFFLGMPPGRISHKSTIDGHYIFRRNN